MELHFSVDYFTSWGQIVCIEGSLPELQMAELHYTEVGRWTLSVQIPSDISTFTYRYLVKSQEGQDNTGRPETGADRRESSSIG